MGAAVTRIEAKSQVLEVRPVAYIRKHCPSGYVDDKLDDKFDVVWWSSKDFGLVTGDTEEQAWVAAAERLGVLL